MGYFGFQTVGNAITPLFLDIEMGKPSLLQLSHLSILFGSDDWPHDNTLYLHTPSISQNHAKKDAY